ncbi:uncharacterized protein LOC101458075 [Ceratitis capitata]|uniref:uncharacterized protein LOC101458075 n=1 Tax=Ceratitis capitata TaxID=7213 RepID=UPI0003299B45|nr:uncharacterized protein LOC101458075 [Ceratitis capitata]
MPMPNRKSIVFFNREQIRSQLVALDYIQARRLKGPIYCALVKELYEEGCKIGASHLKNLAEKENFFYETEVIRDRVCDNTELLMALFENIRVAENVHILGKKQRYKTTANCLYQIIQLVEPHKIKFGWLLEDIYSIIIPISEHIEGIKEHNAGEAIARIYFKTAKYFGLSENTLKNAIKFMEKAMILSRNEEWVSEFKTDREWGIYPTMHLVTGRELAGLLLRYAAAVAEQDPKAAEELTHKAAITLAEIGVEKNKLQYIQALLSRAKYMLQSEDFAATTKILQKVRTDIDLDNNVTDPEVLFELFLYEGICLWNTSAKNNNNALLKLQEALKYALQCGSASREAEALVAIGKIHATNTLEKGPARKAFTRAKQIYGDLGDVLNRKKARYMLAKLKSDAIFPYFMDLLKDSQDRFCGFYNLRQWKNGCKEFWKTMGVEELKNDNIYCLLEDEIKDTFTWANDPFV